MAGRESQSAPAPHQVPVRSCSIFALWPGLVSQESDLTSPRIACSGEADKVVLG